MTISSLTSCLIQLHFLCSTLKSLHKYTHKLVLCVLGFLCQFFSLQTPIVKVFVSTKYYFYLFKQHSNFRDKPNVGLKRSFRFTLLANVHIQQTSPNFRTAIFPVYFNEDPSCAKKRKFQYFNTGINKHNQVPFSFAYPDA